MQRKYKEVSTHIDLPQWAPPKRISYGILHSTISGEKVNAYEAVWQHKRYTKGMYIGVDIGGSKILVVAGDAQHHIHHRAKIATPASAAQGVMEVIHLIEQVNGGEPIKAIGIASPGPIDRAKGRILKTPNMTWEPVDIVRQVHNHFQVPTVLEKDADAAALSEATIGAGQGHETVLYVTISTGVGTGLVINGEIYHGAHDPEGGHQYIEAEGHVEKLETAVSGKAIKRRFNKFGYEIKDTKTWDKIAKDMALGIYNLITIISPAVVVIGGGVGVHFHRFEQQLNTHLKTYGSLYPLPPIKPAKHMETAVAYGALILAAKAARG